MADKEEWFRRTSWEPDAKEAFYARLKRTRSTFHKAQYLRIQALHLQETRQHPLVEAALDLLAELLTNHPDQSQLAQAHHQRAQCLDILDRPLEAVAAFRAAIDAQRATPHLHTQAPNDFGMFCVKRQLESLLAEAVRYLDEFAREPTFPVEDFRANAVRSIEAAHRGDATGAQRFASAALAAAAQRHSGFQHHADLGLVGSADDDLLARVTALSAAKP